MTTYTEYDLSNSFANGSVVDWSSKSLWSTGSIPNDPTALVVFQGLTGPGGTAKAYTVEIGCGESYSICTLDMAGSKLVLAGSLTLQTGVNIISDTAQLDMAGGTLSAGNLHLAGTPSVVGIIGSGTISASDYLYIQSSIISAASTDHDASGCGNFWTLCAPGKGSHATLTISGGELVNAGLLEADSGSNLVVNVGDFTNFNSGVLSGGAYEANGGTLDLHTPGVITCDDASIILNGFNCGGIDSFNAATGKYVALQSTLTTITDHGSLDLESALYVTSLALTDHGTITIDGAGACFIGTSLTVASDGSVLLSGDTPLLNDVITVKQLVDNGTITVEAGKSGKVGPDIIAASAITGTGAIQVEAGAAVELTGSVATHIDFAGGTGTVILDTPAGMTGSFVDFGAGDHITLAGAESGLFGKILSLFGLGGGSGSVTYDYSGTTSAGVLTLHEGSTTFKLAFDGDYTKSNFSVTADSHGIQIIGVAS
jgi:hypothetical protein